MQKSKNFFYKILIIFILIPSFGCYTDQIKLIGEKHTTTTNDGWDIVLENFKPLNGAPKRKYPVIICHGLIGNRHYFKIREEESIVYRLRAEGYDVWLLDLRNREDSLVKASIYYGKNKYNEITVDTYANEDAEKAISYVLEKTKSEKVNWIGHSMGGLLAYIRLGFSDETRIANLVTIASPMYFNKPFTKKVNSLDNYGFLVNSDFMNLVQPVVPTGSMSRFNGYFRVGRIEIPLPFSRLFYYEENSTLQDVLRLKRYSTNNESSKVMRQFSDSLKEGEFSSFKKGTNYTTGLESIQVPTFLIGGRRDHLASPYSIRKTYEQLGAKSTDKEMLIAGRAEGHAEDYGHVDLIIGKNVDNDINIPIAKWLNKRNSL